MEFYKLEANGNNFIVTINNNDLSKDIVRMCSEKYGIGADGYLNIDSNFNVSIFNKDGSTANMCGNGLRCLVKLLNTLTNEKSFTFFVNGKSIYSYIENSLCAIAIDSPILLKQSNGYYINLMNNHFIMFKKDVQNYVFTDKDIDFSKSNNCNIHAIEIINKRKIKIKTYEYGVGVTTSCGSGSICAFFVCNMLGKVGNSAEILTDGGSLFVEMSNNKYILKGVSNLIFKGEYYGI